MPRYRDDDDRDYDDRDRDRYDDDDRGYDRRRSRVRRGFRCPYCGSDETPFLRSQISGAGWAVFVIMIFLCFPLCFIGLLITEEYRVCRDCGVRLG